eukprot:10851321-Lingulodinium_polyedra.AAC.1
MARIGPVFVHCSCKFVDQLSDPVSKTIEVRRITHRHDFTDAMNRVQNTQNVSWRCAVSS